MIRIRSMFVVLLATFMSVCSLAAFAAGGGSGTKYSAFIFPDNIVRDPDGKSTFIAYLKNDSTPPGVSNINSAAMSFSAASGVCFDTISLLVPTGTVSVTPSLSPPGCVTSVQLNNIPNIRNGDTAQFRITLRGIPSSCTTMTWTATANAGNSNNGDPFLPSPTTASQLYSGLGTCDGILDCPAASTGSGDDSDVPFGGSGITGYRGDNKDISACIRVPFDLADNRSSTLQRPSVEFKWDYATQPGASFEYTVPWFAELVNADGVPNPTKLAWLDGGTGLYTTLVPGRACIGDTLPKCVGTLTSAIDANTTKFFVTGTTACPVPASTTVPFAVTIGSERMKVKLITGTGPYEWTVERGDGMTTAPPGVGLSHTIGAKIGSNPLPLDGDGKQMQMCIKSESWKAVGVDYCSGSSGPLCSLIEVTTTVFDLGDGLMER